MVASGESGASGVQSRAPSSWLTAPILGTVRLRVPWTCWLVVQVTDPALTGTRPSQVWPSHESTRASQENALLRASAGILGRWSIGYRTSCQIVASKSSQDRPMASRRTQVRAAASKSSQTDRPTMRCGSGIEQMVPLMVHARSA